MVSLFPEPLISAAFPFDEASGSFPEGSGLGDSVFPGLEVDVALEPRSVAPLELRFSGDGVSSASMDFSLADEGLRDDLDLDDASSLSGELMSMSIFSSMPDQFVHVLDPGLCSFPRPVSFSLASQVSAAFFESSLILSRTSFGSPIKYFE